MLYVVYGGKNSRNSKKSRKSKRVINKYFKTIQIYI